MKLPHTLRSRRKKPRHPKKPTAGSPTASTKSAESPTTAPARRRGLRRLLPSWKLVTGLLLGACAVLGGAFAWMYAHIEIPDEHDVARRQATVYYWADGSRMVGVGDVNRQDVELSQVPDPVRNAVIAAENADFYTDSGVSFQGIGRAALNIVKGEETQGGSTITQQYVKNTYLSQDQTVTRKVKELFLSLKVSNQRTKAEVLEGYLNTSWFGRDAYGIQAAADAYYGVPAKNLNPSQGALLAAMLKGADTLDPALGPDHRKRAEERWEWILDREVETGSMSAAERATYQDFPEPKKPVKPTSQAGQIGYLIDIANKYLKSKGSLTGKDLAAGGYRVHTTFEKDKVRALTRAVEKVRKESLDPKKRAADRHVQFGAASVRPSDGAIVAVYGGEDAIKHFSNNADTAGVPAASAFKPFVFAAALEGRGERFRTAGLDATRAPVSGAEAVSGSPDAPLSSRLSRSLITSGNAAFVQAGKDVGLKKVRDTAVAAGLRPESMAKLEPTFALGTSTPSAVRLAGAYTTFVNAGTRTEPYSVTKVERDGVALDGFEPPEERRVMDESVALEVGRALQDVGWNSLRPTRDHWFSGRIWAGGTGVNDRMKSAWFIGATPQLSTSVAMFRTKPDEPQLLPMNGVGGADSERGGVFPPRIWTDYQRTVAPDSFAAVPSAPGVMPPAVDQEPARVSR
ncbi:transglycosylase domain-containing protein [Streptomyces sp. NPDC091212]|uniref:transglycosylase domain-containing protein n=1 Tax=Streptomyces sp. NPDC091212 TaxID=3155191 RepID=UPI00342A96A0